jgi:hypothetical protein
MAANVAVAQDLADNLRPAKDKSTRHGWTPCARPPTPPRPAGPRAPASITTPWWTTATAGDLDFYEISNLSFTPDIVHAVQVTMVARKDDAKARQLRTKLRSGTTTADGTTQGMATSYLPYGDLYETDPDTALACTPGVGQHHAGRHRGGEADG